MTASADRLGSFAYIDDLRRRLEADEITWEAVLNHLHGSKPWTKADWKARRATLIQEACGACDAVDGPLVLQHIWHPAPFSECCAQIQAELLPAYTKQHPLPPEPGPFDPASAPPQPVQHRGSCPKCGSINIRQLKNGPWSCKFKASQRGACKHLFDTPTMIEYRKFDEPGWLSHLESQHRWKGTQALRAWREAFLLEHGDVIRKRAALISLEEHRRYVSLQPQDVVTRCKRCAFKEDLDFRSSYRAGVFAERARQRLQAAGSTAEAQ